MSRLVTKVATARMQREGGGFMVRRPVGGALPSCDPLIMLDHFGPIDHKPGEAIGAPDHPHRGFETVSYLIEGSMQHKDSAGNSGVLGPGWVQWMTAGSGVVHSEMPSDEMMKNGGRTEGFQLWVNLPAKDKMIAPRYQDTPPEKIPVAYSDDKNVRVKVIAGESLGVKAFIETRTPIMYLDIQLKPGASFNQPIPNPYSAGTGALRAKDYNGFAYVWRGAGKLGQNQLRVEMGQVALIGPGEDFTMTSDSEECNLLLIAGVPLNEPVCWHGPFVMNTQQEIDQAIADYKSGKLGQIAGMKERMDQTNKAKAAQQKSGTWNKSH